MTKTPRRILKMENLTSQTCRWPSGDPKDEDFQFCGQPPELGKPYCASHCELGYVVSKPRKAI